MCYLLHVLHIDVAKAVFDHCYERKESQYDPNYKVTYNFEFLEDFDLK